MIISTINIESKAAFDGFVKYIKHLETVKPDKCDRCHNKKKHARAIMPIARLCNNCQKELELLS